jgi:thioredoxin reductase
VGSGVPPRELLARARAEVRAYGGRVVGGEVATVVREDGGFRVHLSDGRATRCRRLVLATGVVDHLPEVPGLARHWGGDVVHCPYCHGWEVRGQRIGNVADPMAQVGASAAAGALAGAHVNGDLVLEESDPDLV